MKLKPDFITLSEALHEFEARMQEDLENQTDDMEDEPDTGMDFFYDIYCPSGKDKKGKDANLLLKTYRIRTSRILYRLHGINPDKTPCDPDNIDEYMLKSDNKLARPASITSTKFRIRFLTEYILQMNKLMVRVCENAPLSDVDLQNPWNNICRSIGMISREMELFIYEYQKGRRYSLADGFFLIGLSDTIPRKKRKKIQSIYLEQIERIKEGAGKQRRLPDDLLLYSIFKLTYCILTSDTKPKHLKLPILECLTVKNKPLLQSMLGALGNKLRTKYDDLNPMFDCFVRSNPIIKTCFVERDRDVSIGIYALVFFGWLSNDKNVEKTIQKCLL